MQRVRVQAVLLQRQERELAPACSPGAAGRLVQMLLLQALRQALVRIQLRKRRRTAAHSPLLQQQQQQHA